MRSPDEWEGIELGDVVRLLLGWRDSDGGSIVARPVDITDEVGKEFLRACRYGLDQLGKRRSRDYSPDAALEGDEFFGFSLAAQEDDQPAEVDPDRGPFSEEALAASEIVDYVRHAFEAEDDLSREELEQGRWLFYVVVASTANDGQPMGFCRQFNPQRGIKPGRLLTAYQETLKKFVDPVFNFDFEFDVVVSPDEIAVLKMTRVRARVLRS